MRILISTTAVAALFMSTGCSGADAQSRVRTAVVDGCKSGAATQELPGVNADQLCSCIGDKIVEGRSAEELNRLSADEAGRNAAAQQAAMQCAMAQMGAQTN